MGRACGAGGQGCRGEFPLTRAQAGKSAGQQRGAVVDLEVGGHIARDDVGMDPADEDNRLRFLGAVVGGDGTGIFAHFEHGGGQLRWQQGVGGGGCDDGTDRRRAQADIACQVGLANAQGIGASNGVGVLQGPDA